MRKFVLSKIAFHVTQQVTMAKLAIPPLLEKYKTYADFYRTAPQDVLKFSYWKKQFQT